MVHHQLEVSVGRRKTAVARVTLQAGSGKITVNNKPLNVFFPVDTQQNEVILLLPSTSSGTALYAMRHFLRNRGVCLFK